MALSYDTQIELMFPPALFVHELCAPILAQVGIPMEAGGNKILLFTDPRTVAALNAESEEVKTIFRNSGIGLVLYGWNKQGRTDFLVQTLNRIATKYGKDNNALRYAVFDLARFVHNGMKGELNPNPFAAPPPAGRSEKFDLAAALKTITSPEQMQKPKAADHAAVGEMLQSDAPVMSTYVAPTAPGTRVFGRRASPPG